MARGGKGPREEGREGRRVETGRAAGGFRTGGGGWGGREVIRAYDLAFAVSLKENE